MALNSFIANKKFFWKTCAWVSGVVLGIVLVGIILCLSLTPSSSPIKPKLKHAYNDLVKPEQAGPDCPDCVRRLIDGRLVPPHNSNPYPVAVMIDNHVQARPSSGLSRANLVYETEVEGGITRYLAIFAGDQDIDKVGPVRSARPYFLDWAQGLSALFVHCGGSPAALARLAAGNTKNLNEFYNSQYFERGQNRTAPHNIFTSSADLKKYLKKQGLRQGKYISWDFKSPASLEKRGEGQIIKIPFDKGYQVEWRYNKESNLYTRYLNNRVHSEGDQDIKAANIIIHFTSMEVVDDKLRLRLDTTGEGNGFICQDGACSPIEWRKTTTASRTKYYHRDQEIKLNPGTTWIEILRNSFKNKIKK